MFMNTQRKRLEREDFSAGMGATGAYARFASCLPALLAETQVLLSASPAAVPVLPLSNAFWLFSSLCCAGQRGDRTITQRAQAKYNHLERAQYI
jgi:hypothetical protein